MEPFILHDSRFGDLLGDLPALQLLAEKDHPFAHEAAVYVPSSNELFITSNQLTDAKGEPYTSITKATILEDVAITEVVPWMDADGDNAHETAICMANGGVNWESQKILFCAQGSWDQPSGIFALSTSPPYARQALVTHFHGRPFNSVNDVVVHSDGSIWFTDPSYGYAQGFRPAPMLPDQVYRFEPTTGSIRMVADGFERPNGLCFSPDEAILYITDTGRLEGSGIVDDRKPSTIYAYDVATYSGSTFLGNRRVFAFASMGIPDGIKCDTEGNVYSGCGDGVNVWSAGGTLLGIIAVDGGVANFCFGRPGELFLLNEHKLWRARISPKVSGAMLRLP